MAPLDRKPSADVARRGDQHPWLRVVGGVLLAFMVPLLLAAAAGALVIELGNRVHSNQLDEHVLHWMVEHRSAGVTDAMRIITKVGGTAVLVPLTIAGVVLLVVARRAWLATYFAIVVIGASLLSSTAKAIVGRARPPVGFRLSGVGDSAFPSGHATQAAATYLAVAIIVGVLVTQPRVRLAAWIVLGGLAFVVGLSRLYLGVHWCTDVIAGWIIGALWAFGAAKAFAPLRPVPSLPSS